jgi:hypothetical protein
VQVEGNYKLYEVEFPQFAAMNPTANLQGTIQLKLKDTSYTSLEALRFFQERQAAIRNNFALPQYIPKAKLLDAFFLAYVRWLVNASGLLELQLYLGPTEATTNPMIDRHSRFRRPFLENGTVVATELPPSNLPQNLRKPG